MIASYYLRFKTNSLRSTEHNHKQNKVESIDVNILRSYVRFFKVVVTLFLYWLTILSKKRTVIVQLIEKHDFTLQSFCNL